MGSPQITIPNFLCFIVKSGTADNASSVKFSISEIQGVNWHIQNWHEFCMHFFSFTDNCHWISRHHVFLNQSWMLYITCFIRLCPFCLTCNFLNGIRDSFSWRQFWSSLLTSTGRHMILLRDGALQILIPWVQSSQRFISLLSILYIHFVSFLMIQPLQWFKFHAQKTANNSTPIHVIFIWCI